LEGDPVSLYIISQTGRTCQAHR